MKAFNHYVPPDSMNSMFRVVLSNCNSIARTLSQAGYELQPPVPTFYIDRYVYYPNPLKLFVFIVREHGIPGLLSGVVERVLCETLSKFIDSNVAFELMYRQVLKDTFPVYLKHCLNLGLSRLIATAVCHPLQVVTVRRILQLVNGEAISSNLWTAVRDIYCQEGLGAFFSGLLPNLAYVAGSFSLVALLERYANVHVTIGGIRVSPLNMMVAYIVYPLSTVATVMMAGPACLPFQKGLYPTSFHCFWDLLQKGRLLRGSYAL